MRSLLWKEWHEQRWKLAFGSLILGAFALIGLRARVVADELLLESLCFLAVTLLPVLAGTGLVAFEREEGTFESLLSLPVAPVRIFLVKTVMGVVLTAGPVIVAAVVSLAIAGGREMSRAAITLLYLESLAATLSLFFWIFTLTVRLPTETRASLIAMAVVIMWLIVALGLTQSSQTPLFRNHQIVADQPPAPSPLWTVCPFVFLIPPKNITTGLILEAVFVQTGIATVLVLWASRRFTAPSAAEGTS
jgi:hypothetical protein